MLLGPTDLIWIGLVPCAIAALTLWICALAGARTTSAWSLSIGLAVFLGMAAQHLRVSPQTVFDKLLNPRVSLDWLPWLVLVAALITTLAAYAPRQWQRWILGLACVFAVAVPMRLLASNAAAMSRWSLATKLAVLPFWSFLFAALWATLALGRRNGQPLVRSGLLLITACGIAATLAASGSLTLGERAGIVAAALFGTIAVAWMAGLSADGPSAAAGPLALSLLGLILLGYNYNLTATNAALLTISLAASAGWLPLLPLPLGAVRGEGFLVEGAAKRCWASIAIRAALTLIPLALAAASAIAAATANPYG